MADEKRHVELWNGQRVEPGQHKDIKLTVSESYVGMNVRIPIHVIRGKDPGPTIFVTAALHGDEINGTGAIRQLILDPQFKLERGAVILVPVLNILSFERHSRALPDRRDLNRCFPGSPRGSMASRMARKLFDEIVGRSDYGIDLHTAAMRRTNYPNVRANLKDDKVRHCAEAFGCEIIVDNNGPKGAFRRESCKAGCPTIIMEGGEVWKVENEIVASAIRGVENVLKSLDMLAGEIESPDYQVIIDKTKWVRAERSGFLQFHVKPGEIVEKDQPLATNANLLGHERAVLYSPFDGVVIGMSTLPAVSPGEPVCHIGKLPDGTSPSKLKQLRRKEAGLEGRLVKELSSNVMIFDPPENAPADES